MIAAVKLSLIHLTFGWWLLPWRLGMHYNLTWIFDSVACSCFPMTVLEVKFTCIKVCRNDPFRIISWLDWQACCGTLGKMKLASWVSWWIMLLVETLGSLIIFSYLLVWTKFWSSIWMSWSYAPYLEGVFQSFDWALCMDVSSWIFAVWKESNRTIRGLGFMVDAFDG